MVYHLPLYLLMNLLDLFIIYLACGSPFGVYYLLNKKHAENNVYLKSLLITFFWIPFAIRLLQRKVTNKLIMNQFYSTREIKLFELQKYFENFLPKDSKNISLFELRETVERYSGLTYAISRNNRKPAPYEKEIFMFNNNKTPEISALCLNRRNRRKLKSHQTQARGDFLILLKILFQSSFEYKKLGIHSLELGIHSLEFVKLLNDEMCLIEIKKLISEFSQSFEESHVIHLEEDLWKPQEQKQNTAQKIPLTLTTLTAMNNSRKKD